MRSSVRALFHSLLVHLQARHRFELRIKRRTAERVVMIVSGQGALLEAELYWSWTVPCKTNKRRPKNKTWQLFHVISAVVPLINLGVTTVMISCWSASVAGFQAKVSLVFDFTILHHQSYNLSSYRSMKFSYCETDDIFYTIKHFIRIFHVVTDKKITHE